MRAAESATRMASAFDHSLAVAAVAIEVEERGEQAVDDRNQQGDDDGFDDGALCFSCGRSVRAVQVDAKCARPRRRSTTAGRFRRGCCPTLATLAAVVLLVTAGNWQRAGCRRRKRWARI